VTRERHRDPDRQQQRKQGEQRGASLIQARRLEQHLLRYEGRDLPAERGVAHVDAAHDVALAVGGESARARAGRAGEERVQDWVLEILVVEGAVFPDRERENACRVDGIAEQGAVLRIEQHA